MNRLRIFLSGLSICFFLVSQVNAQADLGFFIGISNTKLSGDGPSNGAYRYRLGYIGSLHADFAITEHVSLSIQPGFRSGGAIVAFKDTVQQEYRDSVKLNLLSLTLPLMIKVTSMSERLYFLGGLSFDHPSSLKADNGEDKIDKTDELNFLNINAHFGMGYRIPVKATLFYVELRYLQGLVNLADQRDSAGSFIPRVKSVSFQLTAGWQLTVFKDKRQ